MIDDRLAADVAYHFERCDSIERLDAHARAFAEYCSFKEVSPETRAHLRLVLKAKRSELEAIDTADELAESTPEEGNDGLSEGEPRRGSGA